MRDFLTNPPIYYLDITTAVEFLGHHWPDMPWSVVAPVVRSSLIAPAPAYSPDILECLFSTPEVELHTSVRPADLPSVLLRQISHLGVAQASHK